MLQKYLEDLAGPEAQNPLNRVIRSGYTGNLRSPFFGTATSVNNARRESFSTSFRF